MSSERSSEASDSIRDPSRRQSFLPISKSSSNKRPLWTHLTSDVDAKKCTVPLAAFCFMTGFLDCISFSATFVWCGFQTGNFVQLAPAIARLFEGPRALQDHTFHLADQQALLALVSFNIGILLGRWGGNNSSHTRLWLFLATCIQSLFTVISAVAIWQGGDYSVAERNGDATWTSPLSFVCLGFM
ncbi:hypothetical protein C8J56DRAFT_979511, partial [Mycena floridula]